MTQKFIVRVAQSHWAAVQAHQLQPGKKVEELSYLFGHACRLEDDTVLVTVGPKVPLFQFAPDCYDAQSGGHVRLSTEVMNSVLVKFAASPFNCLINLHSHWFQKVPDFSDVDDADDLRFDHYLRERFEPMLQRSPDIGAPREVFNLSVVLGQTGVDARLTDCRDRASFTPATKVHVIGGAHTALMLPKRRTVAAKIKRFTKATTKASTAAPHTRHGDFITPEQQVLLADLHIGIAGCGGLGSVMAESLARLGVGHITLIDDDALAHSNLNRWQGGTPQDVGQPKASLLADRLREMSPWVQTQALVRSVYSDEAEAALAGCDLMVAGLDNGEARGFLNGVALKYLLPYFDAGVAINTPSPTGTGPAVNFRSRYFAVLPSGTACVQCSKIELIDRKATSEAYMNPAIAKERRAAGYVHDQPELAAPSVYALNQKSASDLVMELLNYVCHWRATATVMYADWGAGTVRRLDRDNFNETPGPDCPDCSHLTGVGATERLVRPRAWAKALPMHILQTA